MSTSEADENPFAAEYEVPKDGASQAYRLAKRFGIDGAVGFAVLARFWQLLSGPITQLLIVFCFSAIQQGYYYAFANLLAMQIFVELGLHVVIINVASHEWSGLKLDSTGIHGSAANIGRLKSLVRTAGRWYSVAAGVFVLGVAIFGLMFFGDISQNNHALTFDWKSPWLCLVVLTGLQLAVLPLTAILEGCGQLSVVNRVRFWQSIAGSLVVWSSIGFGLGLWALCGSAAVRLAGELYLVRSRFRPFFLSLKTASSQHSISWKSEVLPLQWRMAIQGCLLWFATHLAGLVVLKFHGAAACGQYGMMWTILAAIQAASLSWVETRRPLFGRLIAEKNYEQLDSEFFRLSRISVALVALGTLAFTCGVLVVGHLPGNVFSRIAARLPDPGTVAIFALAIAIIHPALCANIYVRAHKKDPFLLVAIIGNSAVASLVFLLGRAYGIRGVGTGYLIGVTFVHVPLWLGVWARTRRIWHCVEPSE